MNNGIYGGTFDGLARAFTNDGLTLFKGTFDITYTPRSISTAYYILRSGQTIYKGADVYYYLYFDPVTSIPDNCFIRLTFNSDFLVSD